MMHKQIMRGEPCPGTVVTHTLAAGCHTPVPVLGGCPWDTGTGTTGHGGYSTTSHPSSAGGILGWSLWNLLGLKTRGTSLATALPTNPDTLTPPLYSYVCFKQPFHMPAPTPLDDDTPQRLIAAGAEVFGRHGYKSATVRAIVLKAKANIGAVNYHFGGKLGLYTAVLQHCVASAIRRYPPDLDLQPGATPEERLQAFVRSTLLRLFEDQGCAWHGPLLAREFADPTPALDAVAASAIRPLSEHLALVVRDLAPHLDGAAQRLTCLSIIGQCFFWGFGRPMLIRLQPLQGIPDVEVLAGHITGFSLAALRKDPA